MLIENCLQTWESKTEKIVGNDTEALGALVERQFHFDTTQSAYQGPSIAWKTETGYQVVPLGDDPPTDQKILEQREQLGALQGNERLSGAVNYLLDQEIEQNALLAFESESIFNVPPASTLKFYEKVKLVAKYRLLNRELAASPKREPETEGKFKMTMLHVTPKSTLHLETFLAPIAPEYTLDRFRSLLENVANPPVITAASLRYMFDSISYDEPSGTLTAAERDEWDNQTRELGAGLSKEQLASWSYRLSDVPGTNVDKASKLYTDWLPLDTEEQYKKMCSLIKERQLSAMFIRTWKIDEAKRVARLRETMAQGLEPGYLPEDEPSEQDRNSNENSLAILQNP